MRSRAAQGRAANFMDNYSPKEIDGSQKDDLPSFYQSDAAAPGARRGFYIALQSTPRNGPLARPSATAASHNAFR